MRHNKYSILENCTVELDGEIPDWHKRARKNERAKIKRRMKKFNITQDKAEDMLIAESEELAQDVDGE